ncbi:MAG: hydroxymethylglutaryl-CoA lyase [Planctomycetota bacterium]
MPDRVRITDVSPRDGLQNEPLVDGAPIPTERKRQLIRSLVACGADEVEVTSFVSPRWVPQLADAATLCDMLAEDDHEGTVFSALVPNERGMEALCVANNRAKTPVISKASVFTAASETFSKKNTNATIEETIARFEPVTAMARDAGLALRGYVSCAIECPYEGKIEPAAVVDVAERLMSLGIDELDLGDTIGKASPETMAALLTGLRDVIPVERAVVHLHDTFGGAAACVAVSLEHGIRAFDGSAGGLGGCPYASVRGERAPGNIALRSLVEAVHACGFSTGVDLISLVEADRLATSMIGGSQ